MDMFVFANGCFWGSEKGVWRLPGGGVHATAVGYAGGFTPNPTYEARKMRRDDMVELVALDDWWLFWWWFGCHFWFSHILGISSSQLTNIFQRGSNHQPVFWWLDFWTSLGILWSQLTLFLLGGKPTILRVSREWGVAGRTNSGIGSSHGVSETLVRYHLMVDPEIGGSPSHHPFRTMGFAMKFEPSSELGVAKWKAPCYTWAMTPVTSQLQVVGWSSNLWVKKQPRRGPLAVVSLSHLSVAIVVLGVNLQQMHAMFQNEIRPGKLLLMMMMMVVPQQNFRILPPRVIDLETQFDINHPCITWNCLFGCVKFYHWLILSKVLLKIQLSDVCWCVCVCVACSFSSFCSGWTCSGPNPARWLERWLGLGKRLQKNGTHMTKLSFVNYVHLCIKKTILQCEGLPEIGVPPVIIHL